MKPKPSGGGALRAKEIWLLKQPRSGARVRLAGLVVRREVFCFCNRSSEKFPLNQKNVEFFPGHFPTIIKLQRNETEENIKGWNHEKETADVQ